jgi:outer membrane lipoprotein carrier protein
LPLVDPEKTMRTENKAMNRITAIIIGFALLIGCLPIPICGTAAAAESMPSLDYILGQLEKRYTGSQFAADFVQESTIKSMEITDFASGRMYVKYPGMMRWEYDKPERQVIITDGHKLWIFRPQDNLVMVGAAPVFFRDGKGASFLSDIGLVRKKFSIGLHKPENENFYELRMVPREGALNVSEIRLSVTPRSFNIARITSLSGYGDDTRIELVNPQFNVSLADNLFSFEIPPGADVQKIDE